MIDIIPKLKSVKCGLESAMNYISEDLEAICDDTMRNYAESAIQDAEASLSVLDSLIQSLNQQPDQQPADDKKFKVSYVFGNDAVRQYQMAVDDCIKWDERKLAELGAVGHYSFTTEQELEAFKKGIFETSGWLEAEQMMTDDEWQQHVQNYGEDD